MITSHCQEKNKHEALNNNIEITTFQFTCIPLNQFLFSYVGICSISNWYEQEIVLFNIFFMFSILITKYSIFFIFKYQYILEDFQIATSKHLESFHPKIWKPSIQVLFQQVHYWHNKLEHLLVFDWYIPQEFLFH